MINNKPVKTRRKREQKTDYEKRLRKVRDSMPLHVVEIELAVLDYQDWKMKRIGEHLRVVRNTVLGQLLKNYKQMVRTKEYKRTIKKYRSLCDLVEKTKDAVELQKLEEEKKELNKKLEALRVQYNVTFEYARKYGEYLHDTKYTLPDAVTVLTVCEMAWNSIEGLLFRNAEKVYFYKKDDLITFQGKQAERCIILKRNPNGTFYVSFNGMKFPLIVKKDDLYVQETLANIAHYMEHREEIDKQNVERYNMGLPLVSTYRVCNNRIVRRTIRGRTRYYLQTVLEGKPVPRRKKDGSLRHTYGVGRLGADIGTQSVGVVGKGKVILKNLAERSENTFSYEHKIYLLQRYLDRSLRAMNPQNYDEKGRIKKGKKEWVYSKRYQKARAKIRELHRKAAESRKYAHNEDINRLRAMGDELIIEDMSIKGLQKKAKEATINQETGKFNRRKRFGKSILRRSPGYFIKQAKYRYASSGGTVREVNTWTFKASQYDHMLDDVNKKKLSKRWHELPDGIKVQRDLYSAFLIYCADRELTRPDKKLCDAFFKQFLELHNRCIDEIKNSRRVVMNSGIKFTKKVS
jgi:hypothetical protein